jgi:hypothetical protein
MEGYGQPMQVTIHFATAWCHMSDNNENFTGYFVFNKLGQSNTMST